MSLLVLLTESRGGVATAKKGKGGGGGEQLQVDPEAGPELKEALEVRSTGTTLISSHHSL